MTFIFDSDIVEGMYWAGEPYSLRKEDIHYCKESHYSTSMIIYDRKYGYARKS